MGYDKTQGVKVLVGCKIPGVTWGYDKFRQVITKIAAVKLMVLDSQIDFDDVGKPTRVDMHAPEVARHEMGFPTDQIGSFQIKGKVADLGQHRVDPDGGSTKVTAGDVHNRVKSASEAGSAWMVCQ